MTKSYLVAALSLISLLRPTAYAVTPVAVPESGAILQDAMYQGRSVAEGNPIGVAAVRLSTEKVNCTGTFIRRDVIITAAHCLLGKPSSLLVVYFEGSNPSGHVPIDGTGFRFVLSPDYNSRALDGSNDDLALIFLRDQVLPSDVEPVTLPTEKDSSKLRKGDDVFAMGAGRTGSGANHESEAPLQFIKSQVVAIRRGSVTALPENGTRICFGDSGGPNYIQRGKSFILVGVTSEMDYAGGDCGKRFSYFTHIAGKNLDWILTQMGLDNKFANH